MVSSVVEGVNRAIQPIIAGLENSVQPYFPSREIRFESNMTMACRFTAVKGKMYLWGTEHDALSLERIEDQLSIKLEYRGREYQLIAPFQKEVRLLLLNSDSGSQLIVEENVINGPVLDLMIDKINYSILTTHSQLQCFRVYRGLKSNLSIADDFVEVYDKEDQIVNFDRFNIDFQRWYDTLSGIKIEFINRAGVDGNQAYNVQHNTLVGYNPYLSTHKPAATEFLGYRNKTGELEIIPSPSVTKFVPSLAVSINEVSKSEFDIEFSEDFTLFYNVNLSVESELFDLDGDVSELEGTFFNVMSTIKGWHLVCIRKHFTVISLFVDGVLLDEQITNFLYQGSYRFKFSLKGVFSYLKLYSKALDDSLIESYLGRVEGYEDSVKLKLTKYGLNSTRWLDLDRSLRVILNNVDLYNPYNVAGFYSDVEEDYNGTAQEV